MAAGISPKLTLVPESEAIAIMGIKANFAPRRMSVKVLPGVA